MRSFLQVPLHGLLLDQEELRLADDEEHDRSERGDDAVGDPVERLFGGIQQPALGGPHRNDPAPVQHGQNLSALVRGRGGSRLVIFEATVKRERSSVVLDAVELDAEVYRLVFRVGGAEDSVEEGLRPDRRVDEAANETPTFFRRHRDCATLAVEGQVDEEADLSLVAGKILRGQRDGFRQSRQAAHHGVLHGATTRVFAHHVEAGDAIAGSSRGLEEENGAPQRRLTRGPNAKVAQARLLHPLLDLRETGGLEGFGVTDADTRRALAIGLDARDEDLELGRHDVLVDDEQASHGRQRVQIRIQSIRNLGANALSLATEPLVRDAVEVRVNAPKHGRRKGDGRKDDHRRRGSMFDDKSIPEPQLHKLLP